MIISDSEMDGLEFGGEELRGLADLIERIIHENSDGGVNQDSHLSSAQKPNTATGEELRELGILWELVYAASKELKALLLNRDGSIGQSDESRTVRKRGKRSYGRTIN
jgi:hypothetical protein